VIRLFIVDRTPAMCDSMTKVMAREPDIVVVGNSTSVAGVLPHLGEIDVVLLTADLPELDRSELMRVVAQQHPEVRAVIMDWSERQEALLTSATRGLAAYVFEDESVEDLLAKMRALERVEILPHPASASSVPFVAATMREH
jgi:DNA-binding NarL/FixJ family response regulator